MKPFSDNSFICFSIVLIERLLSNAAAFFALIPGLFFINSKSNFNPLFNPPFNPPCYPPCYQPNITSYFLCYFFTSVQFIGTRETGGCAIPNAIATRDPLKSTYFFYINVTVLRSHMLPIEKNNSI